MRSRLFAKACTAILTTGVVVVMGNACSQTGFVAEDFSSTFGVNGSHIPTVDGIPVYAPIVQPELKPLTPREYDKSLQVMLGLSQSLGKSNLPAGSAAPFDNDSSEHIISKVHIDSFEYTATKVADAFLASASKASFIPCTAGNATDRACLEKFAIQLATLGYRRPVVATEVKDIVDLALQSAMAEGKFDAGLRVVIQVVLQDPRFLYRFETGVAKQGDFELEPFEYLSKITFFLLGAPPTLKQIEEVKAGALATAESREAFVQKILDDPNLVNQMDLFHAFWMGYSALGDQSASAADFRTETKALISKILQEKLPWRTLLTSNETYANGTLAKLYDLDDQTTTTWKWRKYNGDLRQGLLSQGSFLSVGVKFGDTSTTRRGYNIQKALFCGVIGKPPTVDENGESVNIDMPPPSDVVYDCKEDLYRNTVLARSNCASCHNMMDKIAFGLENFAADASYRKTEAGKPNCAIRGQGEAYTYTSKGLTKLGDFEGPKGLANLALETGYVEKCLAKRLLEFSSGRKLTNVDDLLINKVNALNKKSPDFKSFLKTYLLSAEFSARKGS